MSKKTINQKAQPISAKKAAEILGISVWQLYRIKDSTDGVPQFSYIKGDSRSSPLKFNEATLMEEYERYLANKRARELGRKSIVDK